MTTQEIFNLSETGKTEKWDDTAASLIIQEYKSILSQAYEYADEQENNGKDWKEAKREYLAAKGASQGKLNEELDWYYQVGSRRVEMSTMKDGNHRGVHYYKAIVTEI